MNVIIFNPPGFYLDFAGIVLGSAWIDRGSALVNRGSVVFIQERPGKHRHEP
jgi:hypothetical protein